MEWWTGFDNDVIELFESGIRPRLINDETVEDAMALAFALGSERAANIGRPVTAFDLELALSGLCWWPLKPPPSDANAQIARVTRSVLLERLHSQSQYLGAAELMSDISGPGADLINTLLVEPADTIIAYFVERGRGTGLATA